MKPVDTADSLNGIVLLDETRQRWTGQQAEVIAVGDWEWCELKEECERPVHEETWTHPAYVKEGDWLLVRPRCFVATDEEKVWVCKQSDVLAKLVLEPDTGVPRR